jgi:hypothetical protein
MIDNDNLLTEFDAREYLAARGVQRSPFTMRRDRSIGYGPRFCRIGVRVFYPVEELDKWLAERRGPLMRATCRTAETAPATAI